MHIARIKLFALLLVGTVLAQMLALELVKSPNSYSAQAERRRLAEQALVQKAEAHRLSVLAEQAANRALRDRINAMEFYEAPAAVSVTVEVAANTNRMRNFSPKDDVLIRLDDALVTGSLKQGAVKDGVVIERPSYAVTSLQSVIQKHAVAEGVPLPLAYAIVRSESGFNPGLSNAGAHGLMQIKLQAAQTVGYQGTAEGLLDADTNLRFGMRFLSRIYQMAKGDACRTIAIYRSGNPASASDPATCARAFKDETAKPEPTKDAQSDPKSKDRDVQPVAPATPG